jgi:hypothetical protein
MFPIPRVLHLHKHQRGSFNPNRRLKLLIISLPFSSLLPHTPHLSTPALPQFKRSSLHHRPGSQFDRHCDRRLLLCAR